MVAPLPVWPDPRTDEGRVFFENATRIFSRWKSKGISNPFAFAMLTMAEGESGLDPKALGDFVDSNGRRLPWSPKPVGTPTAFGLYQLHQGRIVLIAKPPPKGAGIDISKLPSIEDQVDASWWELMTFPYYGRAEIEAASTASGAAYQATVTYERAGALDAAPRRAKMAERWTAHWASINP